MYCLPQIIYAFYNCAPVHNVGFGGLMGYCWQFEIHSSVTRLAKPFVPCSNLLLQDSLTVQGSPKDRRWRGSRSEGRSVSWSPGTCPEISGSPLACCSSHSASPVDLCIKQNEKDTLICFRKGMFLGATLITYCSSNWKQSYFSCIATFLKYNIISLKTIYMGENAVKKLNKLPIFIKK